MNKPYTFLQDSYQDLKSLSEAYITHFDEGMQDIYSNTKELVKFIRSRINNKAIIKKYISILAETKYKSNALTFLIFEMSDHKDVIIGGVRLDLLSYLQALRENPDPANNILFGFLEDGGITKTYKVMGEDPKLCAHSEAIEANFRNPFTYEYLTQYYGYEVKEALGTKVRSIAIANEENFRRFSNLASSNSFLISLAHVAGYTNTILAVKDSNPVFQSLKLLKKDVEEEYLRKIVDKSYFFWMLEEDNYTKYEYKGKASKILKRYTDIKKELDHYNDLIKSKKISSISFDNYMDISKNLYETYLMFVSAYHSDLIEVKKKYDPEQYAPDKAYNKTYITQAYMVGKIVKLYSPALEVNTRINPITGEIKKEYDTVDLMDDVTKDAPVLVSLEEKTVDKNPLKQQKVLNGYKMISYASIVVAIVALFMCLASILFFKFLHIDSMKYFEVLASGYSLYGALALGVLAIAMAFIMVKKSDAVSYYVAQYDKLSTRTEINDFLEEEKILYNEDKRKLEKKAFKEFGFISAIDYMSLGGLAGFIVLFICGILTTFTSNTASFLDNIKGYGGLIVLGSGALFGLLIGMIKHKKSLVGGIIFIVLALGIAFAVLLSL